MYIHERENWTNFFWDTEKLAYSEYGKYGQIDEPQERANEINKLYDSDPINYRYEKVFWIVQKN